MAQIINVKQKLIEKDYNKKDVGIFFDYLVKLSNDIKSNWINTVADEQVIIAYDKVSKTGLTIDGETVRLEYRVKTNDLYPSYDYHAYKNRVLASYPETKFDLQLVHNGDDFSFRKESGKVIYTHSINNPFDTNKQIIGAYFVIKNTRGEFLEIINNEDIAKFRASAKTSSIWNAWFGEMVKKSVVKRACKLHFKDIVSDIDTLDNEGYDPNIGNKTAKQQAEDKTTFRKLTAINNASSIKELNAIPDINTDELTLAYKNKLVEIKNLLNN